MTRPFVLAQISDPHIGASWGGDGSERGLEAVVDAVAAFGPDAVVVTGDVADHAAAGEYAQARELLGRVRAPVHVLPGNHDDRAELRRGFEVAGDGPVRYAVECGPLRLVALDTTRPGRDDGDLDAEQLGWLDGALAAAAPAPTVIAMHHPPLVTGAPALDAARLADDAARGLADVVARHGHVRRLVAGHVHRVIAGECGGRDVLTAPSTYVQLRLDFESAALRPVDEPRGFAVHTVTGGDVVSHVVPVA